MYLKNLKKSICNISRIDIIIIIVLLILTITPLIIKLSVKKEAESKPINLYLSVNAEDYLEKN